MKNKLTALALAFLTALALGIHVMAAENTSEYVIDMVSVLSNEESENLNSSSGQYSQRYGCGIYIVAVDNYKDYGSGSIYNVTSQIYNNKDNGFGIGGKRNGIMLLVSMRDRNYAMFVYGDQAEYAFNSYAQEQLEKEFTDNFEQNDWYGGFSDYVKTCGEYLAKADVGKPVRKSPAIYIICSVGGSILIAFVVCMVGKSKMRTVYKKTEANTYTGSVNLTDRLDQFTHTTETRRSRSDSTQSESGGGGSGRSGKF